MQHDLVIYGAHILGWYSVSHALIVLKGNGVRVRAFQALWLGLASGTLHIFIEILARGST